MHRIQHTDSRLSGQVTRGKTAPNRLRSSDHFLASYDPSLLKQYDGAFARALYVDLGYGSEPVTTVESAARLRRVNPMLPVLGVEISPERVENAQRWAGKGISFRLGGFNLPLQRRSGGDGETVRLLRAFNVLRQYEESEVEPAYDLLASQVLPGGLIVDGTSDPYGRVWTANLLRVGPDGTWHLEALVLGSNFRGELDPEAFQTRLPKCFIHRAVPGDPVLELIEDWRAVTRDTRGSSVWGPRAWFTAAGNLLAARGRAVTQPGRWLRRGWLVLAEPGLSLRPTTDPEN